MKPIKTKKERHFKSFFSDQSTV